MNLNLLFSPTVIFGVVPIIGAFLVYFLPGRKFRNIFSTNLIFKLFFNRNSWLHFARNHRRRREFWKEGRKETSGLICSLFNQLMCCHEINNKIPLSRKSSLGLKKDLKPGQIWLRFTFKQFPTGMRKENLDKIQRVGSRSRKRHKK